MSAVPSIVMIGDAQAFANVTTITHDSDYVQVTIEQPIGAPHTYARRIRQRDGLADAWSYAGQTARHVEEAASLVSTPALIAWLLDCGFVRVQ